MSRAATPRGAGQAWATPRGPGGDSLRSAGMGIMITPRNFPGDVAPSVRMAGKPGANFNAEKNPYDRSVRGVRPAQKDLVAPAPKTPPLHEPRSKHRQRTGPGEITVHWGLKDAPFPEPGKGYGRPNGRGQSVGQTLKAGMKIGVDEFLQGVAESVYQSTAREPLGRMYDRGHKLPDKFHGEGFKGFGIPSNQDQPAKEIVFPVHAKPDSQDVKELYVKTHGSYDPGERSARNYSFPPAITENPYFRFGVGGGGENNNGAAARAALSMDCAEEMHAVPPTRIVNHSLEKYRLVSGDHLGSSRNPMQKPHEDPDHVYGIKSSRDNIDAGSIIRGRYPVAEQMPDPDLGCCTVPGRRNFLTPRALGVPTVRSDLERAPIHKRSVASCKNYGDDPSAFNLLFPGKFQLLGVEDSDFLKRRPAPELQGIVQGAGYAVSEADFREVCALAGEAHGDGDELVSLEAFMTAYSRFASRTGRSWNLGDR